MTVDKVDGMNMSHVNQEEVRSGQVYAEILCDFMFKRVFGSEENKDVLIAFLNVMLEDVQIKDVFFMPTEHLGESEEDRTVIFDVSCEGQNTTRKTTKGRGTVAKRRISDGTTSLIL